MLVAWRAQAALAPADAGRGRALLIGFGLASLAVAVPFLWRPQPIKRLLAYSSLEHMGVLALGIGIGSPLALAGVAVHVVGHAIAKSLGFTATIPLLRGDPTLARRPARGVARSSPHGAGALGLALLALSGLPPSPLFASELLILLGGFDAGEPVVAIAAAALLALGFLGLAHALIELLFGGRAPRPPRIGPLTAAAGAALLALTVGAVLLPGARVVDVLMGALR